MLRFSSEMMFSSTTIQCLFFFFQAEDGIRDHCVTGVQTCALPICAARHRADVDANSPILFFDSGVGGLSVLKPTRALLPNAPIVYAADSAGFPYGKRSEAEIDRKSVV